MRRLVLLGGLACAASLACPLSRPTVPFEYLDFRADLQRAVTDTALHEMRGLPKMQARLEDRLTELAAIRRTDSLLATLESDLELRPLAGAIATTLRIELESERVGGGVREAFANPDGQRLAVDGVIVGLGRALYLLRKRANEESDGSAAERRAVATESRYGRPEVVSNSSATSMRRVARIRSTVSPILLFGVDAPAVSPISVSPAGSQSRSVSTSSEPTIL